MPPRADARSTASSDQPKRKAGSGPNPSSRKAKMPPERGKSAASSAYVSAPARATSPPSSQAARTGPGPSSVAATVAGTRKIPLPMDVPTSTATRLHSPRRRGRRSPQGSEPIVIPGGSFAGRPSVQLDKPGRNPRSFRRFRPGRTPVEAPVQAVGARHGVAGRRQFLADLVALTKPRVVSLLLVTAIAPMFMTGRGLPSPALVLAVALGGYLMAGGANAINMWFDRDIDDKMARTRLRPIPAGRVAPGVGLGFGIGLAAAAFALLWQAANPLSAWLALGGLLFYVFVYTVWLKRTSPQNIVIGGAAGAFPPLVGWAAVTGRLDLTALYLFAIVFYWTPPHFWALALIKRN